MKHRLTGLTRKPKGIILIGVRCQFVPITHISKVSVQHLHISMNYLQSDQFVVAGADATDEEERGVSPVHHRGIYIAQSEAVTQDVYV